MAFALNGFHLKEDYVLRLDEVRRELVCPVFFKGTPIGLYIVSRDAYLPADGFSEEKLLSVLSRFPPVFESGGWTSGRLVWLLRHAELLMKVFSEQKERGYDTVVVPSGDSCRLFGVREGLSEEEARKALGEEVADSSACPMRFFRSKEDFQMSPVEVSLPDLLE